MSNRIDTECSFLSSCANHAEPPPQEDCWAAMGNRFKRCIASLEPNQGPATILYVAQRSSI